MEDYNYPDPGIDAYYDYIPDDAWTFDVNNSTVGEKILHYFFYDGYIPEIVINYLLIIIYTIANFVPWGSTKKNMFVIAHSVVVVTITVLCWVFDIYGTEGVTLIWCGELGLMLTWIFCLVR